MAAKWSIFLCTGTPGDGCCPADDLASARFTAALAPHGGHGTCCRRAWDAVFVITAESVFHAIANAAASVTAAVDAAGIPFREVTAVSATLHADAGDAHVAA